MKTKVTVFLVIFAFVLAGCKSSNYEKADCKFSIPNGMNIECGYLTVPEDRSQKNSPMIRLHVAIVRTENPKPDPVRSEEHTSELQSR